MVLSPPRSRAGAGSGGSRRQRRPIARAARLVVAILAPAVFAGAVLWAVTPSVADAPQRVAATVASRHETSDGGVVPAKVAAAFVTTDYSNRGDRRSVGDWAALMVGRASFRGLGGVHQ